MHLCVLNQPGLIKVRKSHKEIVVPSISQKTNEIFFLISVVSSKMVRIKKRHIFTLYLTKQSASIFLWFNPFKKKIHCFFGGIKKTTISFWDFRTFSWWALGLLDLVHTLNGKVLAKLWHVDKYMLDLM